MTTDTDLSLKTCLRNYPHTQALKTGAMDVPGVRLDFVDVKPHIAAFRRMVRDLEFDVAELAPTTYIIARAYGVPIIALPVFFSRRFHHAGLVVRPDSGITEPTDLEGKTVGVRAYSVTTGVWTRGILQEEYGVDIDKVTWMVDDEEHVEALRLPENVVHVPEGKSLAGMIAAGEIDAGFLGNAGIGRQGAPKENWNKNVPVKSPELRELIPDAEAAERSYYERMGIYPMHSTLVLKEEVLTARPALARDIFDAFAAAKDAYLAELRAGTAAGTDAEKHRALAEIVGEDPLPYGLEANRASIEALIRYAHGQQLIPHMVPAEDVFVDL
ncbi:ABC transporter substrate-binding protein [Chelativorans salis]|uniref:PhnD/SsuA/transferrin family substrate-binding protein n=1 Tax=Chelativorans salis TaxID=2978478 RepID=A0ABT2LUA9_9HYPH|nr:PhnD/SsuA/transferrin family substrate-binding protein [Chelativorans sp. EGI FJ00035]MCT7376774.1 PhnD/SsuA/transferrin family substrate-binding protein [Chelativorans sp. EGI FJ00035]